MMLLCEKWLFSAEAFVGAKAKLLDKQNYKSRLSKWQDGEVRIMSIKCRCINSVGEFNKSREEPFI